MSSKKLIEIFEKITEYHKKFDEILEGTNDVEKAMILGSYIQKLADKTT